MKTFLVYFRDNKGISKARFVDALDDKSAENNVLESYPKKVRDYVQIFYANECVDIPTIKKVKI
jgi:hypothetical protein